MKHATQSSRLAGYALRAITLSRSTRSKPYAKRWLNSGCTMSESRDLHEGCPAGTHSLDKQRMPSALQGSATVVESSPDVAVADTSESIAQALDVIPRFAHSFAMTVDALLQQAAAHHREGRDALAEGLLRQALEFAPGHREASLELTQSLLRAKRIAEAIGVLEPLAKCLPGDAAVQRKLGLAHLCAGHHEAALSCVERALELEPDDAQTLHLIANIQQLLGLEDAAEASYRRAIALKPLMMIPAQQPPAIFRALFLFAPGAGNTPFTYLIEQARFETNILNLLPDFDYDVERLRQYADVIVNLVSDVDRGRAILDTAEALATQLGRRVINPPRRVAETDRASISTRLAGIPGTLVPLTRYLGRAQLQLALREGNANALSYPLLVRPAGSHGGDDFEKMEGPGQLGIFLNCHESPDYYVTPYVDYCSSDGYFRKYRFIYVGGEIFPYHLAIDTKWKIHHVTTPMEAFPWMQEEEKAFLDDPWQVFGATQRAALEAIHEEVGLDYFGIDCGLTADGTVVVFEVNASMLVHANNERFPYKNHAVERIKQAFHAMLERSATGLSSQPDDQAPATR